MKLALSLLLLVLAVPACSKSKCEKYADMEVKCGKEKGDMVRRLAEGFCTEAEKNDDPFSKMITAQTMCATKHSDCAAYTACTEAIKPELK